MPTLNDILEARKRIERDLPVSPLVQAYVPEVPDARVFLKLETLRRTGSFKERGALNTLLWMKANGPVSEVVATSAGNHSQSLAFHGQRLGVGVSVVMPAPTPFTKIQATTRFGAKVLLEGETFADALTVGQALAKTRGHPFISAYDHPQIIAGQGTCGLEIAEQLSDATCVIVPIGGGGLASGIALAMKHMQPTCQIIGVQAQACPYVAHALKGDTIPLPQRVIPTIAEGIAVKSLGELTLPILKQHLDDVVLVSDQEIAMAMLHLMERHKVLAEGAGAAAYAALTSGRIQADLSRAVVLVCGGNVDMTMLPKILKKGLLQSGRLAMFNILISDRPGGLARLTQFLASHQASILQIHHDRSSSRVPLYETAVDVTLEVKGPEHIEVLAQELEKQGYQAQRRCQS